MKVAQFLAYFPPHKGGVETVAEEFSKHFVNQGKGEVLNVVFSVGQTSLHSYQKDGYKVEIIPAFDIISNYSFPKFWKKQFRSTLKKVKQRNPDIIQTHTRFFLATFLGGLYAKKWKKKWVHVEHGSGFVKGLVWRKSLIANAYDYTLGRLIFNLADKIVVISKANIPFIKRFTKTPVEVIYRGIDFPQIKKEEKKSDQIYLAFIGRLVKLKGVDVLLSAFSNLIKKHQNLKLLIIGDGEEKEFLEKQVKELYLGSSVEFLGYQEKSAIQNIYFPKIDIFINPSLQEGLPTTVIEALLAKCIVVATDVGGTKEISEEKDLIIVPSGDKQYLEKGISEAIMNRNKYSGTSSKVIEEKFDWKVGIDKYFNLYEKMLGRKFSLLHRKEKMQ